MDGNIHHYMKYELALLAALLMGFLKKRFALPLENNNFALQKKIFFFSEVSELL